MKFAVTNSQLTIKALYQLSEVGADAVIFPFGTVRQPSFCQILAAKTPEEGIKALSDAAMCAVFGGIVRNGQRTVYAADNGSELGWSRAVHALSDTATGDGFRVFDTAAGKLGVLVHEDIYFPEAARALALGDSDFFLCMADGFLSGAGLAGRANSFHNGISGIISADANVTAVSYRGEIIYFSQDEISAFEMDAVRDRTFLNARKQNTYRSLVE
ncbi:MAG: hypothetical protein FWE62_05110 [Firmicutes bacterium]|nr:hypothetical protein [Bacillota bacterium]